MAAWTSEGECGRVAAPPETGLPAVPTLVAGMHGATASPPIERAGPGAQFAPPNDRRPDGSGVGAPSAGASSASATIGGPPGQPERARPLSPGWAIRLNLAADLFLISGIVLANGPLPSGRGLPDLALLTVLLAAVWVITGSVLGYYDGSAHRREPLDDAALISTMVLAMMLVAALFNATAPNWTALPRSLLFCWPMAALVRFAFFRVASRWEKPVEQVLIVGTSPLARVTGEDLARRGRQRVLGYLFLPDEQRSLVLRSPFLGTWMDLENSLRTRPVNEVYIAADGSTESQAVQHAISVCENLGIPFALPAYTFRLQRARPILGKAIADGYLHYAPVDAKTHQRAVKRICDVLIASAALWLLAPLLIIVAVLIKATSRGPVFFTQIRRGLHGKPFEMLKFRSMVEDAEQHRNTLEALNERNGPVFKLRKDPRVTRIGALLRKYSIDELPQLINVLRGDMSIVGPRPPLPEEVTKYEAWQLRRLSIRPGLTCIWQISTDRHRMSFDEWMYLDLQYVDHWNLFKDAEIILRTIPVVASGSGEPAKGPGPRYNLKASTR
jgi:exopolysaccharide biosynthesis polyprenyl glycosylphosphotransferase